MALKTATTATHVQGSARTPPGPTLIYSLSSYLHYMTIFRQYNYLVLASRQLRIYSYLSFFSLPNVFFLLH